MDLDDYPLTTKLLKYPDETNAFGETPKMQTGSAWEEAEG